MSATSFALVPNSYWIIPFLDKAIYQWFTVKLRPMLLLGPIPHSLSAQIKHWTEEACQQGKLRRGDPLPISGGPAWFNSILPDGTIFMDDYSENEPKSIEDGPEKILAVVIATKYRPEFRSWFPERTAGSLDCVDCDASGWHRLNEIEFACTTCSGLGWRLGQMDSE